jgi:hypothetical protein
MPKDYLDLSEKDFGVPIPPVEPEKLFTTIEGKKVEVVKVPTLKEAPEATIHHHNDLDQPGIDITSGITDIAIASPSNNDLLAYDTPSGKWTNQNAVNARVVPEGGTTTSLTLVQPTIGTMTATGGTYATGTFGTPTITGGTATSLTLVTPTLSGGTANTLTLVTPTIGTMAATGGTLVTPTIGTPTITGGTYDLGTFTSPALSGGTASNLILTTPTVGTPALTGGTVNPILYQIGGVAGADGTIVYMKTAAPTYGTVVFTKGIATSVS